jgi:putative Holliday junction resolvase
MNPDNESKKSLLMSFTLKKRVIGIDYGTKRIGVAKSDPLQLFAQPVGTFDRAGLFKLLEEMMQLDEIDKVIVGYPLSGNGEKNAMTDVIDRFLEELREAFPRLALDTVDEHHSSRDARQILIASGKSRKVRQEKGRLDSAAACVMLSQYLESRNQ